MKILPMNHYTTIFGLKYFVNELDHGWQNEYNIYRFVIVSINFEIRVMFSMLRFDFPFSEKIGCENFTSR